MSAELFPPKAREVERAYDPVIAVFCVVGMRLISGSMVLNPALAGSHPSRRAAAEKTASIPPAAPSV